MFTKYAVSYVKKNVIYFESINSAQVLSVIGVLYKCCYLKTHQTI